MHYFTLILSTVMLIAAIPVGPPYGYYVLLRWIICAEAAYIAWQSSKQKKVFFVWAFGITAVMFNPFFPLYLGKELWAIIDLLAAILFIIAIFVIKPLPLDSTFISK